MNGLDSITFSAGKIGYQVEIQVKDMEKAIDYEVCDVCVGD